MRIQITLSAKNTPILIDINYNYLLSSLIYQVISKSDSDLSFKLHKPYQFKFFTFSKLFIKNKKFRIKKDKGLLEILTPEVNLFFSSPRNYICACLIDGLLQNPDVKLGSFDFTVSEVRIIREKNISRRERFVTLSPITVSTVKSIPYGKKMKTIDLYPDNPKFYDNIKRNLIRKFVELNGNEPSNCELEIEPIKVKPKRIRVKDTFHRCVEMVFEAKGSKELLELGYKTGFGEKNSMGFGMVKAV